MNLFDILTRMMVDAEQHRYMTCAVSSQAAAMRFEDEDAIGTVWKLFEACERAFEQTDKTARPADWEMLKAALDAAQGVKP